VMISLYVAMLGRLMYKCWLVGSLDPLRWMVMACPFSPHSQGAWFYCSGQLSLGGGNSHQVGNLYLG
jgi:hypothetical protein